MRFSTIRRQRGVSMLAAFLLLGVAGVLIVLGARVTPTVLEYKAIQEAAERAKAGQTPDEVRRLFDRAAEVEGIKSISSKDLDITRDDAGRVVIRYAYDRQFSLGGPAFLLIKYSGKST